jgi:hypothetical protein
VHNQQVYVAVGLRIPRACEPNRTIWRGSTASTI